MIITKLSDYLQNHQCASLNDMSIALNTAPEALELMLKKLISKGKVTALPRGSACSHAKSCHCDSQQMQLYEWIDNKHPVLWLNQTK